MNRAEVLWQISHYKMTQADIAGRIAELEARIAKPLPIQTNAFGYRLRDRDELRHLRDCIDRSEAPCSEGATSAEKSR